MIRLLFAVLVSCSAIAGWSDETCTPAIETNASAAAMKIKTLDDLETFNKRYSFCVNDADVSEEYVEAVSLLLVSHWKDIMRSPKLQNQTTVSAIIAGISEAWDFNRTKRLIHLANMSCSPQAKLICARVMTLGKASK